MSFLSKLVEMLFPKNFKCNICSCEISKDQPPYICEDCLKSLPFLKGKICQRCGMDISSMSDYCTRCKSQLVFFKMARAPFVYDGEIVRIVHNFKYNNAKYLFESVASFMRDEYLKSGFKADVIVPIPCSKKRTKERGYNQTEMIAKELSKMTSLPVITDCLIKTVETMRQTNLNFMERQKNLLGSFMAKNKEKICGKNILLIDDVYTTGATTNYASEILKEAKVKDIFVLTFARAKGERLQNK